MSRDRENISSEDIRLNQAYNDTENDYTMQDLQYTQKRNSTAPIEGSERANFDEVATQSQNFRSQYLATSQVFRGEIPTGVYSTLEYI